MEFIQITGEENYVESIKKLNINIEYIYNTIRMVHQELIKINTEKIIDLKNKEKIIQEKIHILDKDIKVISETETYEYSKIIPGLKLRRIIRQELDSNKEIKSETDDQ